MNILDRLFKDLKDVDPWAGAWESNPYWGAVFVRLAIDHITDGLPYADKEYGTILRQGRGIVFSRFNKKLKCVELHTPDKALVAQIWLDTPTRGEWVRVVFTVKTHQLSSKEERFIEEALPGYVVFEK